LYGIAKFSKRLKAGRLMTSCKDNQFMEKPGDQGEKMKNEE
jgi:hypothetical protein